MIDPIVSVHLLKPCKLWKGSHEETTYNWGFLRLTHISQKIKRLSRCPDRTPDEEEYLQALRETAEHTTKQLEWR